LYTCRLWAKIHLHSVTELDSCLLSLGKQVLLENDGWASFEKGTTGGSNASEENIYVVKTKDELLQALKGDMANNIP
jgi:pectate lyase